MPGTYNQGPTYLYIHMAPALLDTVIQPPTVHTFPLEHTLLSAHIHVGSSPAVLELWSSQRSAWTS